jgi:natural product precursor
MEKKTKILAKLKLNKLSESELEKRAMKVLKGGCSCSSDCQQFSPSETAFRQYGGY